MKATHILSAVAVAALVLAGCTTRYEPYERQGNGTPNGGRDTGGDPTPTPTAQLTERTDWKVAYVGRADYQEADGRVVHSHQAEVSGDCQCGRCERDGESRRGDGEHAGKQ